MPFDSGAAVIQVGKILVAMGEERASREKLALWISRSAISTLMKIGNLIPKDVDFVAVATKDNYLVKRSSLLKDALKQDQA